MAELFDKLYICLHNIIVHTLQEVKVGGAKSDAWSN